NAPMRIEGVFDYDAGISAIDSVYDRRLQTAIHLIVEKGRAAIVDTGTANAVPYVMKALEAKGIAREAVDYVILTHVHLDHAGGAGSLMARFPGARLTVHPRGARHMIDPGLRIEATIAIDGAEAMRRGCGEGRPGLRERAVEPPEGATLALAG